MEGEVGRGPGREDAVHSRGTQILREVGRGPGREDTLHSRGTQIREKLGEVLVEKTLYTAEVHKYERSWARSW